MIPDADCDGGYTCPSSGHIEGCFRPHVERELLPSTHQVIPDVAVEAAARAIAAQDMRGYDWESFIPDAKAALEAAAPHMLAEAWDLGHVAAAVDAKYGGKEALNPYGSQG